MKKLVAIFAGILILMAGCKKDNALKSLQQQLSGKWELTRTFNGWGGTTDYPPGNGNFIIFDENTFSNKSVINDTTYTTFGSFSIYKGKPCDNFPEIELLELHDILSSSSIGSINAITLNNGELAIGATQCIADGSTNFYRKIQ